MPHCPLFVLSLQHPIFAYFIRYTGLGSLLFALLLSGCDTNDKAKRQPPAAAPVVVSEVVRQDVPLNITGVGNVAPSVTVAVKSRVMGQLMNVHFTEGEIVSQGQLLFTIDPRPFAAALKETQGRLARDKAQLQKATDDLKRSERLVAGGYTSKEQYQQAQTDAAALRATVQADEAAVESAALQLDYCTITAPVSGRAGAVQLDPGNIIKANDDNHNLVTIDATEPVYVYFAVPEMHLPAILAHQGKNDLSKKNLPSQNDLPSQKNFLKDGLAVVATPKGGEPVQGRLSFIDNTVDTRTGTIRLRATFDNKVHALWPGQFVSVRLNVGERSKALVIPLRAVLNGPSGTYVYVITADKKADMRLITLGPEQDGLFVVEKGVAEGEVVVTDGQVRLAQGLPVNFATVSPTRPAAQSQH